MMAQMYNKLERIWKKWSWPEGLRKTMKYLSVKSSIRGDSNWAPPEHKSKVLQLEPTRSVKTFYSTNKLDHPTI
jgi:hypothetical protein